MLTDCGENIWLLSQNYLLCLLMVAEGSKCYHQPSLWNGLLVLLLLMCMFVLRVDSLNVGTELRPSLVSESQHTVPRHAGANEKRMPPKIPLPSFGRKSSSTPLDSHVVVCTGRVK